MTATSGGIASPGVYSIACTAGPSASAAALAREVSTSASRIVAKPGVSRSWRMARVPSSPAPTTSATVMPVSRDDDSSELGAVELTPSALRRLDHLALAPHPGDRSDRAGHTEHEQNPAEHLHGPEGRRPPRMRTTRKW